MSDPIVSTRKLSHVYGSGPLQQRALVDIDLEIVRGSCVGLIGVTGSGKSTLVQHFNGLLRPSSGAIVVDGIDVGARHVDLTRLRGRVGMLFQFPEAQLFASTVFDDVAFGPRRLRLAPPAVRDRVAAALETVGLPPEQYARRSPFELSGGQMRRVALAGVLAMAPSILVLDEPTTGLDGEARAEFYAYVRRAQQERGTTVVLVSHDMAEVAALAERLYVLHEGRLVMEGSPRQIFANAGRLAAWGLAAPPLGELLARLRGRGVPVPEDTLTIEEALVALVAGYNRRADA
jgi:energy-coupling factor transport system ATP-binding protein